MSQIKKFAYVLSIRSQDDQSYKRKLSLTVSARRESWTASTNLTLSTKESLTGSNRLRRRGSQSAGSREEKRGKGIHRRVDNLDDGLIDEDLEEEKPEKLEKGSVKIVKGQRLVQAEKAETGGVSCIFIYSVYKI